MSIRRLMVCLGLFVSGCQATDTFYKTRMEITPRDDGRTCEFQIEVISLDGRTGQRIEKLTAPSIRCLRGQDARLEQGGVAVDVSWSGRHESKCSVSVMVEGEVVALSEVALHEVEVNNPADTDDHTESGS